MEARISEIIGAAYRAGDYYESIFLGAVADYRG